MLNSGSSMYVKTLLLKNYYDDGDESFQLKFLYWQLKEEEAMPF